MRGDYWLLVGILLLITSAVLRQVPLALMALLFVMTGGVSRLWNKYCLHRVDYRRRLSRSHVFLGEEVVFEIEITNRKPLPLPWIQVEDELPENVILLKGKAAAAHEDRITLTNVFPINMYHR